MSGYVRQPTVVSPPSGYDKRFPHVIELRHLSGLRSTEIEEIVQIVEDRHWGWHFEYHDTGIAVSPTSNKQTHRHPMFNHYLCVSFADPVDMFNVRLMVFGA